MRKLRNWFVAACVVLGSLFGYQIERPPTLEEIPSVVVSSPSPSPSVSSVPAPVKSPLVDFAVPKLILKNITGATDAEAAMIKDGINRANTVLASDCFMTKILTGKFTETNGLTNSQIYGLLVKKPIEIGAEFFNGSWKQNYVWKTVGFDKVPSDGVVYMNRYFVKNADTVASLTMHEASHGLGFSHYGAKSTSFPYQMNEIYSVCK